MPAWLTAKLISWIAAPAAIALAIACGVLMIQKGALHDQIHDPLTGYAAKLKAAESDLAQCRANRITLEDATRRQSKAVEVAKEESTARIAGLELQLESSSRAAARARARADRILSQQGTGDVCEDANALILGEVE